MFLLILFLVFFGVTEANADIFKDVSDDGVVIFTNVPLDGQGKVIIKEVDKTGVSQGAKQINPYKEAFYELAEKIAKKHEIDPELVKAVIKAESNWNPDAISPKGAIGLMQLMPTTASYIKVSNPLDPVENIEGGIRYLKYLLEKFNWDLSLALAAYNAGPARVEKYGDIPPILETRNYVQKVFNTYSGKKIRDLGATSNKTNSTNNIRKVTLEDGTILFTNY